MKPELQVILGIVMLAVGLSYAWWIHFRVWMLRQDLFTIRDDLWDGMAARGALDDASHRELRESLHAFIRVAPLLSIFTLLGIIADDLRSTKPPTKVAPEVHAARRRTVARIMRYLFHETLLGLTVLLGVHVVCLLILTPFQIVKVVLSRWVETVMDSTELVAMGSLVAKNPASVQRV